MMIALQQEISLQSNQADVGNIFEVMVEQGVTRKGQPMGRTRGGKAVAIEGSLDIPPGQSVRVRIGRATQSTLIGRPT
jgi:tRNA-2-methylthio-N6-dimethylallyladenosine synthase